MPSSSSFILASASPRRLTLLEQLGVVPCQVIAADIDETPQKSEPPAAYASRMALEKMQKIAQTSSENYVLAADTVVACGRRILPKAEDEASARQCLTLLSGRRHKVYTALALHRPNHTCAHKRVVSCVQFKRLTQKDID